MDFTQLKILELASVLAGPSVGQFFGELGAEVIKVENILTRGDVTRTWRVPGEADDGLSAYFCSANWAKKSIAIDLGKAEGKEIVHMLARSADIVVVSYKPGDAEKLGVDFATLSSLNGRLIYGEITGYGNDNPRVGYDAVIQAESGFMELNGQKDGPPTKMPVALMDVLAAHHLKEGLLIALLNRERTGEGEKVEVSLIQAAISSLANQATNWLVAKKLPARQGSSHPNIAPYGDIFRTKDDKQILLAVGSDQQFANLCSILGLDQLPRDPNYARNTGRVENRAELVNRIQREVQRFSAKEFLDRTGKLNVPVGVIRRVDEVLASDEAHELLLNSMQLSGVRSLLTHKSGKLPGPPPRLGQHTGEILRRLGFDQSDAEKLRHAGVVN